MCNRYLIVLYYQVRPPPHTRTHHARRSNEPLAQPSKMQKKLDAKKEAEELNAIRAKYGIEKK